MKLRQLSMLMFILVLSFLAMSCGQQKDKWQGTIEEVDGVTLVKNPLEPMYGEDALELEEDLTIGEAEGREEYMFSQLARLSVDDNGFIYALDFKAKHIKVFDENGAYIRTIGKPGEGPGEFTIPGYFGITPNNELFVGEIVKISFFSLEGEFIRSQNVSAQGLIYLKYASNGEPIGIRMIMTDDNPRTDLEKYSSEFEPVFAFDSLPIVRQNNYNLQRLFIRRAIRWDILSGKYVVCGYPEQEYKLKVFDLDGNHIKKIERAFIPIKVTDKDIEYEMERLGIKSKEEVVAPDYYPPYSWIYSDDEGRLFISTWERLSESESYYYDVFDAEGRYLLRKAIEYAPQFFKDGKMYVISTDEDGYQYIKRYNVTWNY